MRRTASRTDRLLVIGAGPVGLAMADALKQRGIAFDQVDAGDGVGGLLARRRLPGRAHRLLEKIDRLHRLPDAGALPRLPQQHQMLRYLENLRARPRARRNNRARIASVVRAAPLADESWQVTFESGEERTYKGVVVCNGHHWDKRLPQYPGRFTGSLIHSKDYKEPRQLQRQARSGHRRRQLRLRHRLRGGARWHLMRPEPALGLLVPA